MKYILLILLLFSARLFAGDGYTWKDWRKVNTEAKVDLEALQDSKGNSTDVINLKNKVIEDYIFAERVANDLNRKDLDQWCINNASFAYIVLFKKLTSYTEVSRDIEKLSPKSKVRLEMVKALQEKCGQNFQFLDSASASLENIGTVKNKDIKKRVNSNLDFIAGIKKFITKEYK